MQEKIEEIKKNETKPFVIENFFNEKEIKNFLKLYSDLPIEINNKRQKIVKKKWSENFYPEFQIFYKNKLKSIINDYEMDNPKTKDGFGLGLFRKVLCQFLYMDTGFDFNKIIYKQLLIPLTNEGETVILKIDFMVVRLLFRLILLSLLRKDIT